LWPNLPTPEELPASEDEFKSLLDLFKREYFSLKALYIAHESREYPADEESRGLFNKLYLQWRRDTAVTSNITTIITHPAYYKIIAMGESALPYVFESLANGGGPWLVALEAMTSRIDTPLNRPGWVGLNGRQLTEAWLNWGREHGFLRHDGSTPVPAGTF
jgi:hypothetical protein